MHEKKLRFMDAIKHVEKAIDNPTAKNLIQVKKDEITANKQNIKMSLETVEKAKKDFHGRLSKAKASKEKKKVK